MSHTYESVLSAVIGKNVIDSNTRRLSAACVAAYLKEMLEKHSITIDEEDVDELAYDIIDELASADMSYQTIN